MSFARKFVLVKSANGVAPAYGEPAVDGNKSRRTASGVKEGQYAFDRLRALALIGELV